MSQTFPQHPVIQASLTSRLWDLCRVMLLALTLASSLAYADNDHDRARQALQAGEVLPLATILERVAREQAGKVLDVELERENEHDVVRWVYKVKVLGAAGTVFKFKVDARSGELLTRKRKD